MSKAVILLSGGLDSAAALALSKNKYSEILALTFDYSQKALKQEIKASKALSRYYGIENKIIKLGWLSEITASALCSEGRIPDVNEAELDNIETAEKTAQAVWVPNRNLLFISIAACFAEAQGFQNIIIGANKEESLAFPDNSKSFIDAANETLKYSVKSNIKIYAPLLSMAKTDILKKAIELNLPFNMIYSCYKGSKKHCGSCESCLRLKRAAINCGRDDIINIVFGE